MSGFGKLGETTAPSAAVMKPFDTLTQLLATPTPFEVRLLEKVVERVEPGETPITLKVHHGYGSPLSLTAYKPVQGGDPSKIEWTETGPHGKLMENVTSSPNVFVNPVTAEDLDQYIEAHLKRGHFDRFVREYFEESETALRSRILRDAWKHRSPLVREVLKLVITYCLTASTLLQESSSEDDDAYRVQIPGSRFDQQIMAPTQASLEVRLALARKWRQMLGQTVTTLLTTGKEQPETHVVLLRLFMIVLEPLMFDLQHFGHEDYGRICDLIVELVDCLTKEGGVTALCTRVWRACFANWRRTYRADNPDSYANFLLGRVPKAAATKNNRTLSRGRWIGILSWWSPLAWLARKMAQCFSACISPRRKPGMQFREKVRDCRPLLMGS